MSFGEINSCNYEAEGGGNRFGVVADEIDAVDAVGDSAPDCIHLPGARFATSQRTGAFAALLPQPPQPVRQYRKRTRRGTSLPYPAVDAIRLEPNSGGR